jgi:formylglycine-generating enzyme required for sulfatase activity
MIMRHYFMLFFAISTMRLAAQSAAEVPELLPVPGGIFLMGCTQEQHQAILDSGYPDGCQTAEPFYFSKETPVHRVELPSFELGKYELSQRQWLALMSDLTSSGTPFFEHCGLDCPIEQVSWYDALVYCNRLSVQQGFVPCYYVDTAYTEIYGQVSTDTWHLPNSGAVYWLSNANGYRLPTEAEWEYAARGGLLSQGHPYAGGSDLDSLAWYGGNSDALYRSNLNGKGTQPVGLKQPNELGFYDMSGNVWEWCWDWFSATYYRQSPPDAPRGPETGTTRVVRGGAWPNEAVLARLATRNVGMPSYRFALLGFRLARTP